MFERRAVCPTNAGSYAQAGRNSGRSDDRSSGWNPNGDGYAPCDRFSHRLTDQSTDAAGAGDTVANPDSTLKVQSFAYTDSGSNRDAHAGSDVHGGADTIRDPNAGSADPGEKRADRTFSR